MKMLIDIYQHFLYNIYMSQHIVFHDQFDSFANQQESQVFEVFPSVFKDQRGYFCEVMKEKSLDEFDERIKWFKDASWIKQINRSCSKGKTIRGCHAQKGKFCQAKLVQALTSKIYDFITDARPNSKTFGITQVFILDPEKQNQLFVPRGFLHAFATVNDEPAIFEYMCDNVFDKSSEIGISPLSILPKIVDELEELSNNNPQMANDYFDLFMIFKNKTNLTMSPKDLSAQDYKTWMKQIEDDYIQNKRLWYK